MVVNSVVVWAVVKPLTHQAQAQAVSTSADTNIDSASVHSLAQLVPPVKWDHVNPLTS